MKAKETILMSMMKPLLLTLDLQAFADPGNPADPTPPTPPTPPADPVPATPPPAEPTPAQGAELSLDSVQSWLQSEEAGKKWLQSLTDTRVTDAIKTYETKTLPKKLDEEIQKRFPAETEEQKKIRDLQLQMEKFQSDAQREKLNNVALSKATENSIPASLVGYLVGSDEETTVANIETFKTEFEAAIQKAVDARFAAQGQTPSKPQNTDTLDAQIEQARVEALNKGTAEARARYAELKMKKMGAK